MKLTRIASLSKISRIASAVEKVQAIEAGPGGTARARGTLVNVSLAARTQRSRRTAARKLIHAGLVASSQAARVGLAYVDKSLAAAARIPGGAGARKIANPTCAGTTVGTRGGIAHVHWNTWAACVELRAEAGSVEQALALPARVDVADVVSEQLGTHNNAISQGIARCAAPSIWAGAYSAVARSTVEAGAS